ncbi:MAG: glycosyltransferase, partial [Pseudomonadota bacterium]
MLKMARAAQAAGHQVTVFTLRWEAEPEPDLEVRVLPIEGMSRHTQYERFAETLNDLLWRESFDLVVGFNKIPGLDVYYAGDSSYIEKSLTQRSALYRQLPRFK